MEWVSFDGGRKEELVRTPLSSYHDTVDLCEAHCHDQIMEPY